MLLDKQDRFWTVTEENEVYLTVGDQTTKYSTSDGLTGDDIREIVEDQAGRIWLIYRRGVALYKF